MLYKFKFFLFFVGCSVSVFSQPAPISSPLDANRDIKEKERQIRGQAIYSLKDNLSKAKSISNLQQRAVVVAEASSILWDHDSSFAKESLVTFVEKSLAEYQNLRTKEKITPEEKEQTSHLQYALRTTLKTLTQKDPQTGRLMQERYFKISEGSQKTRNLNQEMELAVDGLDLDEQRTLSVLSSIIQQRIPSQFPHLISELNARNPSAAKILVQRAVQNLAINPNYSASDALYLSIVIFNEDQLLIPLLNDVTQPNVFGFYISRLNNFREESGNASIAPYFAAVKSFFDARSIDRSNGFFESNLNLLQSYFLLEKLRSYDRLYNISDSERWDQAFLAITSSMQPAGFTPQTLADVKGYAIRLTTSNNPLGLDDGTSAFEKAEDAKTPEEKLNYLIAGIIQSIGAGHFTIAERKIFDMTNAEIRDPLYLYLHSEAALKAIEKKEWDEFEKRTEKLNDKRLKAFLYVKAVSALQAKKSSVSLLSELIVKAEKNIEQISDKAAKASALVVLTSQLLALANTDNFRNVPHTIFTVNEAPPEYTGAPFEARIIIPNRGIYAKYIGENSYKNLFSTLARLNWTDSQVQSLQIKRNDLQAIAQIAAAKEVLQKPLARK